MGEYPLIIVRISQFLKKTKVFSFHTRNYQRGTLDFMTLKWYDISEGY